MRRQAQKYLPVGLAVALTVAAPAAVAHAAPVTAQPLAASQAVQAVMAGNAAHHDNPADHVWDSASVVPITLTGSGATTNSPNVTVSGGVVTITAPGTYRLTGNLTDGQLAVDTNASGIVRLILAGVSISNSRSAALYVANADKVMVVLAAGTTNQLSDATRYVYPDPQTDEPDAALFSDANLTIAGEGSLTVRGNYQDGIASKDGVVITGGRVTVNAADDGIRGKDYVVITGGAISVNARSDGLKSSSSSADKGYVYLEDGTVSITAGGDGIQAESDVVIGGGELTITSGGGSGASISDDVSAKGAKGKVAVVVGGGRVNIDAADDGLHSDGYLTVDGGTITIVTGDDALRAETTLEVSGGTITVPRSYEGMEALRIHIRGGEVRITSRDDALNATEPGLDEFAVAPNANVTISGGTVVLDSAIDNIDSNGSITISGGTLIMHGAPTGTPPGEGLIDANGAVNITGGTVIGAGAAAMVTLTPPSTSGQGWVAGRLNTSPGANTLVHIVSNGRVLASYRAPKSFQEVFFSSNQVANGQTYEIYTGGSVSGAGVDGFYASGGNISGATLAATLTAGQYSGGFGGGWPGFPGWPPFPGWPGGPFPPGPTPPPGGPTPPPGGPTPPPGSGGSCTATYTLVNQWPGGFQVEVQITAGASPINGWTVTWNFSGGASISQSWNANITTSGTTVTARNVSHNGSLGPGASTTFGFIGSGTPGATPSLTCTAS